MSMITTARHHGPRARQCRQRGFTVIEVLVALLVLAIGILGLAALQTTTVRGSSSSHHRSQAVLVAYDAMDRLRANRSAAIAGDYNIALADDPAAGDGAAPLADDDLIDWFGTYLALLPGADAMINCTNTGVCTITIQWDDSRAVSGSAAQQFSFTSEI